MMNNTFHNSANDGGICDTEELYLLFPINRALFNNEKMCFRKQTMYLLEDGFITATNRNPSNTNQDLHVE